jgi:hypothetical protein
MGEACRQQTLHPGREVSGGDGHAMSADGPLVSTVPQPQRRLEDKEGRPGTGWPGPEPSRASGSPPGHNARGRRP